MLRIAGGIYLYGFVGFTLGSENATESTVTIIVVDDASAAAAADTIA
jgi:hypothetical protein